MIDETKAILVRARKQEDDDNEGCFNTKLKPFKSALDVYLQLNFMVESEICSSSMIQPLQQQLRAPRAPMRSIAFCGSPLIPAVLLKSSPSSATPTFYLHGLPARYPGDWKGLRKIPKEGRASQALLQSQKEIPSVPPFPAQQLQISASSLPLELKA